MHHLRHIEKRQHDREHDHSDDRSDHDDDDGFEEAREGFYHIVDVFFVADSRFREAVRERSGLFSDFHGGRELDRKGGDVPLSDPGFFPTHGFPSDPSLEIVSPHSEGKVFSGADFGADGFDLFPVKPVSDPLFDDRECPMDRDPAGEKDRKEIGENNEDLFPG